ncbi:MAG: sigma-54-dependent Fis family transcriptional regulator [Fibrobacteres bacterium]|nr:sigma-54-dependent Fis family transcriptional regulator [Fibrobacterota bacterium]
MAKILVVDDQESIRESLSDALSDSGHSVSMAQDGLEAVKVFNSANPELVISDLRMPGMDGLELLKTLKNIKPDVIFILMTAYGTVDSAVAAIKQGAEDYIMKPFDLFEMERRIARIIAEKTPADAFKNMTNGFEGFISVNEKMRKAYELAKKAASGKATVLIRGESGTGKEGIAKAIHFNSGDADKKPFIKLNCAALAEGVLESELFGHEKGAYTGAFAMRKGKFELADGGTLFLDEVGDIPLTTQVKLLRVIQEKEFERVGGNETLKVETRIVAATNRNLEDMCVRGLFREDLFYRLNVIPVYLPPLRERREDIPGLVEYFLKTYKTVEDIKASSATPALLNELKNYDWPGNIRELMNVVERMAVLASSPVLDLSDMPPELKLRMNFNTMISSSASGLIEKSIEFEKELIEKALSECGGSQVDAAKKLHMDRSTLRYRMKKYGLLP